MTFANLKKNGYNIR